MQAALQVPKILPQTSKPTPLYSPSPPPSSKSKCIPIAPLAKLAHMTMKFIFLQMYTYISDPQRQNEYNIAK